MSNTRKCREAHGGKFTRPRDQWKGKRRNRQGRDMDATQMNTTFTSIARTFGKVTAFKRKAG